VPSTLTYTYRITLALCPAHLWISYTPQNKEQFSSGAELTDLSLLWQYLRQGFYFASITQMNFGFQKVNCLVSKFTRVYFTPCFDSCYLIFFRVCSAIHVSLTNTLKLTVCKLSSFCNCENYHFSNYYLSDCRRVWIEDPTYWTLWYSTWLHVTVHYHTYTVVSTVTFH
jgi:hypothetical protein